MQQTPRTTVDNLRTQVASRAVVLGKAITAAFSSFRMGAGAYTVDLQVPEGQSTAGGKQARQNLRLVPHSPGHAVIVAGTLDPVASSAEVRTFEHVAMLHEARFNRPLGFTAQEYAGFLAKLEAVLKISAIRMTPLHPPPELLAQRGKTGSSALILVMVLLGLAALVGVAVFVLMRAR